MSANRSLQHKAAQGKTPQGNDYSVSQVEYHQGLLPRPDDLAKYENICPGIAHRIMAMAEEEQKHRQQQEAEIVKSGTLHQLKVDRAMSRGQWLALAVVVIVSSLSGYAIHCGFAIEGKWIACSVIVSSVLAFLGIRSRIAQSPKESSPEEQQ